MTGGQTERIGVVGGGIVGLAIARELTGRRPGTRVVVVEKEDRVAAHQTGHNSGVVHAGIYYKPGSLKAELCSRGRTLLREYCAERALPYDECGKLVVAVDPAELRPVRRPGADRASENGVPGLVRVEGTGITDIEPHAAGLVALHSPATAITDYAAVAVPTPTTRRGRGRGDALDRVTGIRRGVGGIEVATSGGPPPVDRLVVCAGLQSDRVSRLADGADGPRIVPFRGEYMRVAPGKADLVRGLIYPVPDPRYPFLGVHFTRRVGGGARGRPQRGARSRPRGLRAHRPQVAGRPRASPPGRAPGGWPAPLAYGPGEMRGSLSVRAYMTSAQRYVPEIGPDDVRRAGAGIRAQAVDHDGSLVDDFRISHQDGVTAVRNAPSPAATSSLAIAEHVVDAIEAAT